MSRWPLVPAGDVLELVRRPVAVEPQGSYTEIGVRSFGNGIFHKDPVSGAQLGDKRVFEIHPGELVINIVFAWEGAVAVSGAAENGTIGSHRFLTYRADPGRLDVEFVRAHLTSRAGREALLRLSPGAAGRNRTLSQSRFDSLQIPLPSLDDQRRAVRHYAAVSRKLEISSGIALSRMHELNQVRRRLIADAASSSSRAGIGELLRLARAPIQIDDDQVYEQIGIRSFGRGLIRYSSVRGADLSKLRYFTFPGQALIVSNIKAWEGAVALSQGADTRRIASARFLPYLPRDSSRIDVAFVLEYLLSDAGLQSLGSASPGSADRNRTLARARFEAIEIPVPPPAIQRRVRAMSQAVAELAARETRARLLHEALRVSSLNYVVAEQ